MKRGDRIYIKSGFYKGCVAEVVNILDSKVMIRINNVDVFISKLDIAHG